MKQKFSISISKPCSEKFNQFKQTTTGGFCNSCKKEVIDFRNMSNEELIEYLKSSQERTCGYFKTSQLKAYSLSTGLKKTARFKYLKIIGLAFFSMISLHHIQAQESEPKTEIFQQTKKLKNDQVKTAINQDGLLTGIISDETGPLPGANILLKGTSIGTATNFDGEFTFPNQLKEGDVLVVSFIGYETQNIKIKKNQWSLNVLMDGGSCVLMGQVDVNEVYKSKRSLWQKIKGIF
tara:strand:+ start:109 stop:816 length:708 start_codon:yes stop_codon:yes gene_type:complete